ncbi:hypothetical protein KO48_003418 [Salmonella enterica subsp. enterica serovar Bredeney]|nr:hypothetical protein [Salmonella enterica subsp. enterica serovar Bredeney]
MQNTPGSKLYSYAIPPIDFDWAIMPTVESLAGTIKAAIDKLGVNAEYVSEQYYTDQDAASTIWSVAKLYMCFLDAKERARKAGWDGTNSELPRYFTIPDELDVYVGFIFKQYNNGDTFVVSPIPLAHLEQYFKYES